MYVPQQEGLVTIWLKLIYKERPAVFVKATVCFLL